MDSKKGQELNHTNTENVVPSEAPPSYKEAMGNTPYPATAPPLETQSTNPSANNVFVPNQYPPQGPPPVYTANDPRFAQWDDRATRILITNRLRMNDQFAQARNQEERDLLWNLILLDLVNTGYNNLLLYNLVEYWQFQIYIYQSILNGLSSSAASPSWQYFEPMHSVFGSNSSSGLTDTILSSDTTYLPSSSISSGPTFYPTPMIGPSIYPGSAVVPPTESSRPVENVETPSTQLAPNADTQASSSANNASELPSSVQPLPDTSAAAGNTPSLSAQPVENPVNVESSNLLSTDASNVEVSTIPAMDSTTLDVVSSSAVAPSLGDAASASAITSNVGDAFSGDVLPTTDMTSNLLSGIDSGGNNIASDVITNQPTESLVPTLFNDDVITTQPTFSGPTLTSDDVADHDGCCGDGDCCGGDDDCCAGCDDCCTGCDECGDCGDCGDCYCDFG